MLDLRGLNWFLKTFPSHIIRISDVIHANHRTGSRWWVFRMNALVSTGVSMMSPCVGPLRYCYDSQLSALSQQMVSCTESNSSTGAVQKLRWLASAFNMKTPKVHIEGTHARCQSTSHSFTALNTSGALDQKICPIQPNISPAFQVNTSLITILSIGSVKP